MFCSREQMFLKETSKECDQQRAEADHGIFIVVCHERQSNKLKKPTNHLKTAIECYKLDQTFSFNTEALLTSNHFFLPAFFLPQLFRFPQEVHVPRGDLEQREAHHPGAFRALNGPQVGNRRESPSCVRFFLGCFIVGFLKVLKVFGVFWNTVFLGLRFFWDSFRSSDRFGLPESTVAWPSREAAGSDGGYGYHTGFICLC